MEQQLGRSLEDLVRRIEGHLLPAGYSVRMGERAFDEDGEQLAEFDIVIEGSLGSSTVKWLIECRDRPSAGKAPIGWIQQLIGRRTQFHFDRVFGVSTTGFSNGAKGLAAKENIYLRTVSKIDEIEADFRVREFAVFNDSIEAVDAMEAKSAQPRETEVLDISNPFFRIKGQSAWSNLPDFVFHNLDRQRGPQMVLLPKEGIYTLRFGFTGQFQIKTADQTLDATIINFQIQVRRVLYQGRALTVQRYDEGGRQISHVGEFVVDFPSGPVKYTLYWLKGADGKESIVIEGFDKTPGRISSAFLIAEPSKPPSHSG